MSGCDSGSTILVLTLDSNDRGANFTIRPFQTSIVIYWAPA